MAAYSDSGSKHEYEYDHLVSLELGGATNDARNLWPEPGSSPNPKDSVENEVHRLVCDGDMRLAQAQHTIATGWVAWAKRHDPGTPAPAAPHRTPRSTPGPVGDVNSLGLRQPRRRAAVVRGARRLSEQRRRRP
jgi:hypothetical protein